MNKSPAFQWYPKDILASARVQEMTLAEEGAYRRLLDYCWLNGSIPADEKRCARLIGKGCTNEIAKVVLEMFEPDPNDQDRMIHDRLEAEREKQESNSKKRKAASEARWNKQGKSKNGNGKQVKSTTDANAMQMQCSSSSTSSSHSFSSSNEKEKGGGGTSPPAADFSINQGKGESLKDYLLRKQLEYPEHDVGRVYEDFKNKCGSPQYPKLKNTQRHFDKWIAEQDVELPQDSSDKPDWQKAIEKCGKCDASGKVETDGIMEVCKHK